MPKAIEAPSKEASAKGRAIASATWKSTPRLRGLRGRALQHLRAEVCTHHLAGLTYLPLEGQRQIARARGAVEDPAALLRPAVANRSATPQPVDAERQHLIRHVVPRGDRG